VWDNNALAASLQHLLRRAPASEEVAGPGEPACVATAVSHPAGGASFVQARRLVIDKPAGATIAVAGGSHVSPTPPAMPAAEARGTAIFGAQRSIEAGKEARYGRTCTSWALSDDQACSPGVGAGVQLTEPVGVRPVAGSGAEAAHADRKWSGRGGVDIAGALRQAGAEVPEGTGGTAGAAGPRRGRSQCSTCSSCTRWCNIC
jgi:hypothetical protein